VRERWSSAVGFGALSWLHVSWLFWGRVPAISLGAARAAEKFKDEIDQSGKRIIKD
jgi:hypothetical protein